jgi:hypothetical protein
VFACMVLLFEHYRGCAVIELAVTFTPVCEVAVKRGFGSLDHNEPVFGPRNGRKGFYQQLLGGVAILLVFLVEYLKCAPLDEVKGVPDSIHFAVFMVVSPASDQGGQFFDFYLGSIVRVVNDAFDFITEGVEVVH